MKIEKKMKKKIEMTPELQTKLEAVTKQGDELFKAMSEILLKTEPTSVGATAMTYALGKLTACVLKAQMLTGMPVVERFKETVDIWSDLLEDAEHYGDQQPFDDYVLTLMDKPTYRKEEAIRPFDQEW